MVSSASLYSKTKHSKPPAMPTQDEIDVVAHIPLSEGAVTRFLETRRYHRDYLYAEHESGKLSLIDVTTVNKPTVLRDVAVPEGNSENLVAVAGNAVLVSISNNTQTAAGTGEQTFRIMSFADSEHPAVKQQFDHVTAIARDESKGLVFLANDSGLWILQLRYAVSQKDAELQRSIEKTIFETP